MTSPTRTAEGLAVALTAAGWLLLVVAFRCYSPDRNTWLPLYDLIRATSRIVVAVALIAVAASVVAMRDPRKWPSVVTLVGALLLSICSGYFAVAGIAF